MFQQISKSKVRHSKHTNCMLVFYGATFLPFSNNMCCLGSSLVSFCLHVGNVRHFSYCLQCRFPLWQNWEVCSATCGGGEKVRGRSVRIPQKAEGKPCDASLREVGQCIPNVTNVGR